MSIIPNTQSAKLFLIIATFFVLCLMQGCYTNYSPKPRGYFRISLPAKEYVTYDSLCPFVLQVPKYSVMTKDEEAGSEPCWLNLHFPHFDATLHLSYKDISQPNELNKSIEDAYRLTYKHVVRAEDIIENTIQTNKAGSGMIYELNGQTATFYNFYITDSTRHFMRGALYFYAKPNPDSIAPALDFLKKDINFMLASMKWKD